MPQFDHPTVVIPTRSGEKIIEKKIHLMMELE